ncbi:hypothetical protein [Paenibacillus mesotrionivorans]|uniref:Uncharacterized protein n=1 Tax=Paenibacillus mesotrionivorans TaxID=3160968 RepID=A0ACC7NXC9_9BACL
MEEYQSEDFIEKYVEKVKKDFLIEIRLNDLRTKINRILQKENLYFDDETYLVLQSETKETETRICNFFVLPTHSLYFDDGEKIHEAGIAVELYSQLSDEKYKRILVNLSDEAIEKGNWLTAAFIDRDFFVYKPDLYRHLRIAIKLSSRIIKKEAKKVFYNEEWLEDDDAVEHISEYKRSQEMLSLKRSNNQNEKETHGNEDIDAVQFLAAQKQYISEITLLSFPEKPSDETNEWGWEDNDYYYLVYSKTWSWIRAHFNRNGFKLILDEKDLDHYLIEAGVFESNEVRAKSKLKRADRKTPPLSKRVFMINKARFNEFLSEKRSGI